MAEEKPFTISDETRVRFGIPLDRPIDKISKKKRALIRSVLKKEGEEGNRRGRAAEIRFVEAWRDAGEKWKFWFDAVRPATWYEDNRQATDAFIRTVSGEVIRIQVKITRPGEGICTSLRRKGIVLVLVDPADPYEKVRYNTVAAIVEQNAYNKMRHDRRLEVQAGQ